MKIIKVFVLILTLGFTFQTISFGMTSNVQPIKQEQKSRYEKLKEKLKENKKKIIVAVIATILIVSGTGVYLRKEGKWPFTKKVNLEEEQDIILKQILKNPLDQIKQNILYDINKPNKDELFFVKSLKKEITISEDLKLHKIAYVYKLLENNPVLLGIDSKTKKKFIEEVFRDALNFNLDAMEWAAKTQGKDIIDIRNVKAPANIWLEVVRAVRQVEAIK